MEIKGIAAAFPERIVTNEDVVSLIRKNSQDHFKGDLERTLKTIQTMLKRTGTNERRWLDHNDQAYDYIERASLAAMDRAEVSIEDIDLLIFASVDKRVLEPGMSFLVAKALGMQDTECFDITEGCGGWVRATQLAQLYINAGTYQNVMIVTAEFCLHESMSENNFQLKAHEDLEWALATFTAGEGATATVFGENTDKPWEYRNKSLPQLADLCLISCFDSDPQYSSFNDMSITGKGQFRFVSYAQKMHSLSLDLVTDMIANNSIKPGEMDLFIPHTQSLTPWKQIEKNLQVELPYKFLLPEYGNLINNSMPAGIALSIEDGTLTRGKQVSALMTAAGMSFTLFNFIY